MRIERIEVVTVHLPLEQPYTIAYETVDHVHNVFLQLITDGPHVGLGCAAPTASVTGETVAMCEAALEGSADELQGADPLRRMRILEALGPVLEGCPAAAAALDMALLDLVGKHANLAVWQLLGGYRRSIATCMTLGIEGLDGMVASARSHAAQGFRALKIKGGLDPDHDADVVRRVRHAVGPDIAIRFDANQGYTPEQAHRFLAGVAGIGLEVFEQPTPRARLTELAGVTRRASMPVMADESLLNLADAFLLAKGELADMLNIKLMKVGGIDAAITVNAVGRAAGLEVMVGCMDESALAIAAGLHFALARPNVELADLDGHLDLVHDPGEGAVTLVGGELWPSAEPGLGLRSLRL